MRETGFETLNSEMSESECGHFEMKLALKLLGRENIIFLKNMHNIQTLTLTKAIYSFYEVDTKSRYFLVRTKLLE